MPDPTHVYLFHTSSSADVSKICAEFRADPHVVYCEPDFLLAPYFTPNDPDLDRIWAFDNDGSNEGTVDADIDALIQSGDAREKAYALHVKANRGEPRFNRRDVLPMLRADEPLVRELMMTTNMMRFRIERIRRREIAGWEDRIARDRANFLLDHRIRKVSAMTLAELEAFLDTTADDP